MPAILGPHDRGATIAWRQPNGNGAAPADRWHCWHSGDEGAVRPGAIESEWLPFVSDYRPYASSPGPGFRFLLEKIPQLRPAT